MDFSKLVTGKGDILVKNFLENPFKNIPTIFESIEISKKYNIALHPAYLFYWNELTCSQLIVFLEFLLKLKLKVEEGKIKYSYIPKNDYKRTFEILGIEHKIKTVAIEKVKSEDDVNILVIDSSNTYMLLVNLGVDISDLKKIESFEKSLKLQIGKIISFGKENLSMESNKVLSANSFVEIRDKGGSYIGARMGRPEKAKMRKQFNDERKSHALFPVGSGVVNSVGSLRANEEHNEISQNRTKNLIDSFKEGFVEEDFRQFYCSKCDRQTIFPKCEVCSSRTIQEYFKRYTDEKLKEDSEDALRYRKIKLDLKSIEKELREVLGVVELPKDVKGITATINKHHTVEHISKGFLRKMNNVFVNKDGTIRYDMIEMGLTHFKPFEVGTSVKRLRELGYTHDQDGAVLERDDQIVEIFPQDVILPDCAMSGDEFASDYVINTGKYVDDLLEKLYKLPRFYNFKTKEDTIGHLIIGLAPHTSAGIVGRILGYSKTQGCFSHPVWHAAQRRNLDGDENGIMLLMDGLINFSREYLPDRRGSRTMDVSLVLTSHLYLDQIDDEVHGMDIAPYYNLDFYRANKKYISPKEVKIEKVSKRVEMVTNDFDVQYLGYKFTHDTTNMNNTILCSSYKYLPSMGEKLDSQLELAKKIRAVDEDQVGTFIIDKHFMKDIKGNLRKFGMQKFRCAKCNTSYRRPPLVGKCTNCGNPKLIYTISEGSIKKYINHSLNIIRDYNVDPYIEESLHLANLRIDGVFGKEIESQKSLSDFFGK